MSILSEIKCRLAKSGIISAQAEAEIILSEILDLPRLELQLMPPEHLSDDVLSRIEGIVSRRERHEPLQYILGYAWFMNLCLQVGPGVLIPRPETELAVETICREAVAGQKVCDLGTGSGAIALAVAYERPDLLVTAVEISDTALHYARANGEKYKLKNVEIIQSDLFAELDGRRFDWIIANLPYVTNDEYSVLPNEVLLHEPESALRAGGDGFDVIRIALQGICDHLNPGGKIIFEIGDKQGVGALEIFAEAGFFNDIKIVQDLTGRDRFVTAFL
jgi:release factor glutamine methyltransferase